MTNRSGSEVIAIDGPAGTGKSSVARLLARRVGGDYLDTGAMYRAATLATLRAGVSLDDPDAIAAVAGTADVRLTATDGGEATVFLDGADVTEAIRSDEVTAAVSAVSAVPAIRSTLVELQRAHAGHGLLVVEGRDIGTVVFPDAAVKIYLTATPEARALRRHRQNEAAGRPSDLSAVLDAVNLRDHRDSTRAASPLRPADDAVVVDTSDLSRDEVLDELQRLVSERMGVQS